MSSTYKPDCCVVGARRKNQILALFVRKRNCAAIMLEFYFKLGTSSWSFKDNINSKVCSINFEPPDIDLCSVCHVYPISR